MLLCLKAQTSSCVNYTPLLDVLIPWYSQSILPSVEVGRVVDGPLHNRVVFDHQQLRLDIHHTCLDPPQEFPTLHVTFQNLTEPLLLQSIPYLLESHSVGLEVLVQRNALGVVGELLQLVTEHFAELGTEVSVEILGFGGGIMQNSLLPLHYLSPLSNDSWYLFLLLFRVPKSPPCADEILHLIFVVVDGYCEGGRYQQSQRIFLVFFHKHHQQVPEGVGAAPVCMAMFLHAHVDLVHQISVDLVVLGLDGQRGRDEGVILGHEERESGVEGFVQHPSVLVVVEVPEFYNNGQIEGVDEVGLEVRGELGAAGEEDQVFEESFEFGALL